MSGVTTRDVARARSELVRMRGSLRTWLSYRAKNDAVLAGTMQTKKPANYARAVVLARRDSTAWRENEDKLATQLHVLLSEVAPDAPLPDPASPGAAVELAQIAISGQTPAARGPSDVGSLQPWMWPILIVGGLLLAITTAIKTQADLAAEKERIACIEAGACTDTGFWLKAAAVIGIGWFVWRELGVGVKVKEAIRKS